MIGRDIVALREESFDIRHAQEGGGGRRDKDDRVYRGPARGRRRLETRC